MTVTSAINSPFLTKTFEPVELLGGIQEKFRDNHIPSQQVMIGGKGIHEYSIRKTGRRRTARKHKPSHRFIDSKGATSPKRSKEQGSQESPQGIHTAAEPGTLERTGIPALVSALQTFLDHEERRLVTEVHRPSDNTRSAIMAILSANDELSRLNNACMIQLKKPESVRYAEHSGNVTNNVTENAIDQEQASADGSSTEFKDKNPDDYQGVIAHNIPDYQQYPAKIKSSPRKERILLVAVNPENYTKAKADSISLIRKARNLLFNPGTPNLTFKNPKDVQGWQSLETVINFPLIYLNYILNFISSEQGIETLISRKKELFRKIFKDAKKYHDKTEIWDSITAQSALNSHWEELMELQYQLHTIRQQTWESQFETVRSGNKLPIESELLKTEVRQTAMVLYYLTSFSLRLRSERHQELSKNLQKVTE